MVVDDFEKLDRLSPEFRAFAMKILEREQVAAIEDRKTALDIEGNNQKEFNKRIKRGQWFALITVLATFIFSGFCI